MSVELPRLPCVRFRASASGDEHKGSFYMRLGKYLLTAAAATMAVAPAVAAPAANMSASKSVRAGAVSGKKSEVAGSGIIVAVLAAAAVVAGIVIVADSDDDADSN
ncbi:hypothetical protein [Sphingomonas ginsenosidivorax]|uniref:hypothetical protein n=1 Tax=Sphingomonas ginsenosidivorax TaxID=862135 RepID=UPI0030D5ABF4